MSDQHTSADEIGYALSRHVPDMARGFSIVTSYGELLIQPGPIAEDITGALRRRLTGERDEHSERLENWATMAAQELQDMCDEAQEAAGDPDGEGEMKGVRMLLRELDEILQPDWQKEIIEEDAQAIAGLEWSDL